MFVCSYVTLEFSERECKEISDAMNLDPDFEVVEPVTQFPYYIERIALLYARDLIKRNSVPEAVSIGRGSAKNMSSRM